MEDTSKVNLSWIANRPNPSLQATAGRFDASIKIMKTYQLQSTLALASGA
jgi:hypothetical protein